MNTSTVTEEQIVQIVCRAETGAQTMGRRSNNTCIQENDATKRDVR